MVQQGLEHLAQGANPVDLVAGLEIAVTDVLAALRASAHPLRNSAETVAVATIAANDAVTGAMVAEAIERVGPEGLVTVEFGSTVETQLEVVDGMSFDRGYLSHHMVTDIERMQVVLDDPLILMTDLKLQGPEDAASIEALLKGSDRPLLIMAEEVAPNCLVRLLGRRERGQSMVAAIHPPEYGHWRKSMLEDIAIVTGGRVIARELGGRLEDVSRRDLGSARQVRITANQTIISKGAGEPATVTARRAQVARQYDAAPQNIERDKLQERLAKLSGGAATVFAGGATPAEQKRRAQMIEDAINATRAAAQEGVVAGGGTALLQIAPDLASTVARLEGGQRLGASLLQSALAQPLSCIVRNCGRDPGPILAEVARSERGTGFDAQTGRIVNLMEAGVVDPVKVSMTAIRNAASIAALILTTQTPRCPMASTRRQGRRWAGARSGWGAPDSKRFFFAKKNQKTFSDGFKFRQRRRRPREKAGRVTGNVLPWQTSGPSRGAHTRSIASRTACASAGLSRSCSAPRAPRPCGPGSGF
jgi:chaperonin GroEL